MVQEQGAGVRDSVSLHHVNDRYPALLQRRYCAIHGATKGAKKKAGGDPAFKWFYYFIISVKNPALSYQTVHESRLPLPGFLHQVPAS